MKRNAFEIPAAAAVAAAVLLALAGCPNGGGNGGGGDGGSDANDLPPLDPVIKVSGTASIHPEAQAWMMGAGQPVPSIVGITHRVEEPLKAGLDDPNAVFGTTILDATGAYSVAEVDTANVNIGIGGGVQDERDAGAPEVIRSATSIFDTAVFDAKPSTDISNAKTFILPVAFEQQLTDAVTREAIATLNNRSIDAGAPLAGLVETGFVFGQVVDSDGAPVAGVKLVAKKKADFNERFLYPSADYSSATTTGTSANGTFVFVGNEQTIPEAFQFEVENRPEYKPRNAGTKVGVAVIITVYPGTTPPP